MLCAGTELRGSANPQLLMDKPEESVDPSSVARVVELEPVPVRAVQGQALGRGEGREEGEGSEEGEGGGGKGEGGGDEV